MIGSGPERADGEERRIRVEEEGGRLDRWLADRLDLSRTRIARLIDDGEVTVDGEPVPKSFTPRVGQEVVVRIPPPEPLEVEPEPIPLEVVHEDDELLVVEKPAGMVVHPAPAHRTGTLVHALMHHVEHLSSGSGPARPGIVHRLDRDTSGLLLVAKNDRTHRKLSDALARREVDRGYLAATWGHLDADRLTVDRPIGRDPSDRTKMAVSEEGKRAVTHLRRLERWRSADLLALKLETGRTHQIRVHLRDEGHPVVNDGTYAPGWERGFVGAGGRWAEEFARRCERMFLHAARLVFEHPTGGERMSFTSSLPEPLDGAVRWAREHS